MLPSRGYFEKIDCPVFRYGFCERPFCQYRHDKGSDKKLAPVSLPPRAPGTGRDHITQYKACGGSVSKPAALSEKDHSLLELERINKAIETVKCEVEKEQKKLSHYKTLKGKAGVASSCPKPVAVLRPCEESPMDDHGKSRRTSSSHSQALSSTCSASSKYVIDKSKPRTDLEYDPLSNYSAYLGNHKQYHFEEERRGNKRMREDTFEDKAEVLNTELESQESDDDGVLVIDIPPLEADEKKPRSSKKSKVTENEKLILASEDAQVPEEAPYKDALGPVVECETSISTIAEISQICDGQASLQAGGVDLRSEGEILHIGAASKSLCSGKNEMRYVKSCLNEDEPLQTPGYACALVGSLWNLAPQKEHDNLSIEAKISQEKAELDSAKKSTEQERSKQRESVDSHLPLPSSVIQKLMQPLKSQAPAGINSVTETKCEVQDKPQQFNTMPNTCHTRLQPTSGVSLGQRMQQLDNPVSASLCLDESGQQKKPKQAAFAGDLADLEFQRKLAAVCAPEPSASEVECGLSNATPTPVETTTCQNSPVDLASDYSDLDVDLSDSDPMEECYRIFMEDNESKLEDPSSGSTPVEVADEGKTELEKKPDLIPGQKRRVAHVSKYNEAASTVTNKIRQQQIVIPFREAPSQLANPTRIQLLQQQASVLTAAVKGGQAFVAATTGQKKPVTVVPSAPLPTHVQTAHLNVIPIGMAVPWTTNVHFIIPEGNINLPVTQVPAPQRAASYTPAKAISTKRKPKMPAEASSKVPHDVRQRYVNQFLEEFLKTSFTVNEAFEKALAEEKAVFDRSANKLKYLSIAVNSLKRLKNQSHLPIKSTDACAPGSRGNTVVSPGLLQTNDAALYEQLKEHVMSEEMLRENGYPFQHPSKPGAAILYGQSTKRGSTDPLKRICCRCGASYSVSLSGKHIRKEECNYHSGKVLKKKIPGGMDTRYSCCEGAIGTPGCQVFKLHVHDGLKDDLECFVKTFSKPVSSGGNPGVFAADCEMCYTTQGLELARVTVVNSSLQVVYDTFVQPDNEVIDYNTRFSGVTEADLKTTNTSIRDVQAVLLNLFSAETILIGHNFDYDLCALKLLHSTVVDTAMVFPHRLGLPHKRSLRSLTADYLRRIIQESVDGHDSSEDATACMELMLWQVKEDAKVKRW
ncbi:RNA exonuclease 1 homolog isoform X1 [Lepisosteus oculatus]|uniref:RNA exonuclease 1 homolog isoform X1 n=1 Tax=Lepisosteus oculatus TaxID=7918 RepID=UPI00371BD4BA